MLYKFLTCVYEMLKICLMRFCLIKIPGDNFITEECFIVVYVKMID